MMDYGEIIRTAFSLAWRNKSLWLLGLFAAGGTSLSFDWISHLDFPDLGITFDVHDFLADNPWLLVLLGGVILTYILIYIVLNCICTPALIDAVNRLTRGGVYRFRDSFSSGVSFLWRFLGLSIVGLVVAAVLILALVLPIVLLFAASKVIGLLSLLPALPVFFCLALALTNVFMLAERALVVRNVSISDAISEGYHLFMNNKLSNLIIFLLYILLSIAIAIGVTIIFAVLATPFVAMGLISTAGLVAALVFGIPLFLVLSLPVSGFLGAAFESMYTLFYFRLVEPHPQTVMTATPGNPGE